MLFLLSKPLDGPRHPEYQAFVKNNPKCPESGVKALRPIAVLPKPGTWLHVAVERS